VTPLARLALSLLLGAGSWSSGVIAGDAIPQSITLRASNRFSAEAIRYVAEISAPRRMVLPPGEAPEAFLRALCGEYTIEYQNVFIDRNAGFVLRSVPYQRDILVPACAKWALNSKALVQPGDNLERIIAREIGHLDQADCKPASHACSSRVREQVQRLNRGLDLNVLKVGTSINLPVSSRYSTVSLNPDGPAVSQVLKKIDELNKQAAPGEIPALLTLKQSTPGGINLIRPVSIAGSETSACKPAEQPLSTDWPFNSAQVVAAIQRTKAKAKTLHLDPIVTRVAVFDTGYSDTAISSLGSMFERFTPGLTDEYGFVESSDADRNYEYWDHGSFVMDLIRGGPALKDVDDVSSVVRFKVVNLVQKSGDGSFRIPDETVFNGALYSGRVGASIANLSIGTSGRIDSLIYDVTKSTELLVVAAAGNESSDLNFAEYYPGSYGGTVGPLRDQLVTVAAHDANGDLAEFSNWGRNYVDIAAPGCSIKQIRSDGSIVYNSGTSFAAPLVSFAAVMLRALGGSSMRPADIKKRILVSSRFRPDLARKVASGGALDLPTALSLYDDVIIPRSGTLPIYGHWADNDDVKLCKEYPEFALPRVRKVSPLAEGGSTHLRILYDDSRGFANEIYCTPDIDGVQIDVSAGDRRKMRWAEVDSFVTAIYP
jgi:hypothetical protein